MPLEGRGAIAAIHAQALVRLDPLWHA